MKINNKEVPDLCFGTGITFLHIRGGLKGRLREIKLWTKMIMAKDKNLKNTLHLSSVVDVCMKNGCTMFDTSRAYDGSEYRLGKALKKYPRESYYIVTKLCNRAQYKGNIRESFFETLKDLNMDYVDLYLMHFPVEGHFIESWREMEKLYNEGYCKAIGVCNFNEHHLEELKKYSSITPMVNQIECHPLFTQTELRKYCKKNNIQVMAYTATARMDGRLLNTKLVPIAKKYNKSIAQIILRWHQQIGNIPIVNSTNKKHMLNNIDIKDFTLTKDEIETINKININSRLRFDPDNCDFTKL